MLEAQFKLIDYTNQKLFFVTWYRDDLLLLQTLTGKEVIQSFSAHQPRDLQISRVECCLVLLNCFLSAFHVCEVKSCSFCLQIEIDIEPTDKVERIKERVEEKEGIPPPQQRLIFSGKQMWDPFLIE